VRSVFVSHAAADAALVDKFVDTVLRNGCNLVPDNIFYTSGEDTGIPSGEDLIATVRREVGDATLVVGLISRTYQTRPVCVAELGAAWSRAGALMPLLLPGCDRGHLDGVLDGMTIRSIGDEAALNELHDRVVDATGRKVKAATWSRHKAVWLAALPDLADLVPIPDIASVAEIRSLRRDLDGAREALAEVEEDNAALRREVEAVSALKDAAEVAAARLPADQEERFRALAKAAKSQMRTFDSVVDDAIWATRFASGLVRPSRWDDPGRNDDIDRNLEAGFLYENPDEATVYASTNSRKVERALEAVEELQAFLLDTDERFASWFRDTYDFYPSLEKKAVWDQLF